MPEILKLTHFINEHRVTEVKIRRGGVEAGLHPQRSTHAEFVSEVLLDKDLVDASTEFG